MKRPFELHDSQVSRRHDLILKAQEMLDLCDAASFNAWPSAMPVVDVTNYTDPFNAFQIGVEIGSHGVMHAVETRNLPSLVLEQLELPDTDNGRRMVTVYFSVARSMGTGIITYGFNLDATLFDPMRPTEKVIRVQLGCDHRFDVINQRNCYREYDCVICDLRYAVDSGD